MKNLYCKEKKICRLCDSKKLKLAIDLNKTPLANSILEKKNLNKNELTYPLKVNFCLNCYHLQLSHTISSGYLFKNYLYVTGTSKETRNHFKSYALELEKKSNKKRSIKILDIASNDGTFLQSFRGSTWLE